MSRSVSTPLGAIVIAYAHWEDRGDIDVMDQWDDLLNSIRGSLTEEFPSLYHADGWVGREDRVLLENSHTRIGISEYIGTISIWALPKSAVGAHWIKSIIPGAQRVLAPIFSGELMKLAGICSNGEAVYSIFKPGGDDV